MSTHVVDAPTDEFQRLLLKFLRAASDVTGDPVTGAITYHFIPDLTTVEATELGRLEDLARANADMQPADMSAIAPRREALKVFRQQSASEFMAKTATQRDRELFDATTDLIAIVLRLLRD